MIYGGKGHLPSLPHSSQSAGDLIKSSVGYFSTASPIKVREGAKKGSWAGNDKEQY